MLLHNDILDFLQKDIVKNINMINFIESYPIHFIEKIGESVVVKGKSDENWVYISSSSEKELKMILEKCEENEYFAIVEDWMVPLILENRELEWKLSCMKLIFPDNIKIGSSKNQISKLTANYAEYIYHNSKYKDYTSIEYITDRINNGIALGIFNKDILTAWLMTHDDGAIGFLNVLEEYRKKGYGYELTMAMVDKLRKIRKIPFVHIEEDNFKSMNLAFKTGFVKDRKIHWIKRKK